MRYVIALAALLLAGPFAASAQEPDPASDQVMHVLVTCLHAAARRLDDGRSDAATVALSIRSACVPEYFTARDVIGRHVSPAVRQMYIQEVDASFAQTAIAVVLDDRKR